MAEKTGFIHGMLIKIRVMPDCIVITSQDTRELWGCIEGLSVVPINRRKVAQWLKEFPGALNSACDVPKFKRITGAEIGKIPPDKGGIHQGFSDNKNTKK